MRSVLLAPLSAAYGAGVAARAALYRNGWLRAENAPVPVISVGNLVAGGTGKTPVVAMVARLLKENGCNPAILSRGYGGRRKDDPLVVSDGSGRGPSATSAMAGDEPVMLASLLPDVPIVVARRRVEGARLAASRLGARCLVLDDGFQHIALRRNLDIVLLDAERPLDDGRLLPSGMLREPPSALARAGALAFTGPRGSDAWAVTLSGGVAADVREDRSRVAVWARAGTPFFQIDLEPTVIVSAREPVAGVTTAPESLTATWLAGMRVVAFAGIARPQRLVMDLRRLGAELVSFFAHDDHHPYTRGDVDAILAGVRRLQPDVILTTEKDLARLRGTDLLEPLVNEGLVALRLEAALPERDRAGFMKLILAAARAETAPATEVP